jgi:glutamate---cysteine ligase / carboxylate-amine ligase
MYYPTLNIGIEEEYQLIDPQSRELLGYVTQSMSQDQLVVRERTPEVELAQPFGEAVIEVGTPVCADIKEAREKRAARGLARLSCQSRRFADDRAPFAGLWLARPHRH